jgi:GT2 family glycosyltransferase
VKFYEHCAAGRPTVATPMPELARAGDLVFRAADAGAFAAAIRAAAEAGRDDGYAARLRRYAGENSWADRAGGFLQAMLHVPKVSVVILSYGDVTLTLAALRSLTEGGGAYPALEIVVADNGSDAAALARLRSASKTDARIRLIENGRNLGFAAGNNRGIAAATGEYVLLLNNDTYVAPGAVSAMVAHLERDPRISVVDPLTNTIGNEARVAVAYADMEEMTAERRRVTTGYRAQATDIRVAAYFCAMLRRRDFERFGLLAEVFGQGMFEDDDHCAEIRAQGYRCVLAEDAFVHHNLSASFDALGADRRRGLFDRNRALFEARRGPWVPHAYRTSRPAPTLEPRR